MKNLMTAFCLVFALGISQAQTVLKSDPYHTRMEFRVTHMLVNTISGSFDKVTFVVNRNDEDFTKSSMSFTADVNSINTGVEMRNNHLKKPDFFDVEKYPELTFKSKKIVEVAKNVYHVTGDFTMHGVTKPVTVTLYDRGLSMNASEKKIHGYKVKGELSRSDFNIGSSEPISEISDKVEITGDFEMILQ